MERGINEHSIPLLFDHLALFILLSLTFRLDHFKIQIVTITN